MNRGKTFILGIGAQKAGTTWLEAQLSKESFFSNDHIKEYHIFNKLACFKPIKTKKIINKKLKGNKRKKSNMNLITKLQAMRLMPKLYFDHFDYIYCRDQNITHVSDITPDYATLPADTFHFIKKGLEEKGFKIKIIFLMRDPVERAWSHLRMINRLNHERNGTSKISAEAEYEQLKKFYKSDPCSIRTRYQDTSSIIEDIFPKNDIYYGFYETLFNQVEINKLTDFLEAPHLTPNFNQVVHSSPKPQKTVEGMDSLLSDIRSFYDSTYCWANDRFPSTIPGRWIVNS